MSDFCNLQVRLYITNVIDHHHKILVLSSITWVFIYFLHLFPFINIYSFILFLLSIIFVDRFRLRNILHFLCFGLACYIKLI